MPKSGGVNYSAHRNNFNLIFYYTSEIKITPLVLRRNSSSFKAPAFDVKNSVQKTSISKSRDLLGMQYSMSGNVMIITVKTFRFLNHIQFNSQLIEDKTNILIPVFFIDFDYLLIII